MPTNLRLGLQRAGNNLSLGWEGEAAREPSINARTVGATATIRVDRGRMVHVGATTRPPTAGLELVSVEIVPARIAAATRPATATIRGRATEPRQTRIAATTKPPAALVKARTTRLFTGRIAATTSPPSAILRTALNANLLSGVTGSTRFSFRHGSRTIAGGPATDRQASRVFHEARPDWSHRGRAFGPGIASWHDSERVAAGASPAWRAARLTPGEGHAHWRDAPWAESWALDAWRAGTERRGDLDERWKAGLPMVGKQAASAWADADPARKPMVEGYSPGPRLPQPCDKNSWQDADLLTYVRRPRVPWTPPPPPWAPFGNDLHLCRLEPTNRLTLGYQCQRRIPRRRSYSVQHQIAITRLSDATPIPTQTITISLDADSWAWTWSATLLGAEALPLVLPSEQGEPVTLEATIDGHTWHLVVEDWQEDRAFGSRSISVSGRGLSAWLGAPYQPATSGTLANARTLHQAMEELLPLGEGWTIDWADGTPDWLLPSGAWNWTNQAPIQTIHAAAQGVGLVVVPGMAARTLTIQPRYAILPWDFADAEDPDLFHIPDSAILSLSRRQAVPSQANAVYVHGGDAGGIIARVWHSGSAGDRLAATVSDERITHVDGARLLGTRILAGQETQPEIRSITLPLGGVFLLARIGELVALEIGASEIRGLVNSVSITADGRTVRQTITIGEDTPNVWAMWRRLLPEAQVLLGEILAIHEGGTRTVELLGGGRLRVRGEGAVGAAVWVRGGRIEGEAPDLPSYEIEVF